MQLFRVYSASEVRRGGLSPFLVAPCVGQRTLLRYALKVPFVLVFLLSCFFLSRLFFLGRGVPVEEKPRLSTKETREKLPLPFASTLASFHLPLPGLKWRKLSLRRLVWQLLRLPSLALVALSPFLVQAPRCFLS